MAIPYDPNQSSLQRFLFGVFGAAVAGGLSFGIFYLTGMNDPILPFGLGALVLRGMQELETYLRARGLI